MNGCIYILSKQWYRTLSTHEITLVCCELNRLSSEHIKRSHINLSKVSLWGQISSMQQNFHRHYYLNFLIYEYLSCNPQIAIVINGTKISLAFSQFFESIYLKYIKYLQSECKSYLRISNEMQQHVFRSGVRSYIFTFFSYVPGLYFFPRMW